jgi:hypothetical protein
MALLYDTGTRQYQLILEQLDDPKPLERPKQGHFQSKKSGQTTGRGHAGQC